MSQKDDLIKETRVSPNQQLSKVISQLDAGKTGQTTQTFLQHSDMCDIVNYLVKEMLPAYLLANVLLHMYSLCSPNCSQCKKPMYCHGKKKN